MMRLLRLLLEGAGDVIVACLFGIVLFGGFLILPAMSQTPKIVGANCRIAWNTVTTYTNGQPTGTGVITYNLYVQTNPTPEPIPGTTKPTIAKIPGPSSTPCVALIASGPYYAWITAVATHPGGVVTESALSQRVSFNVVVR